MSFQKGNKINLGRKRLDMIGNIKGFKKGYVPWNKGKKLSEKHKINLKKALKGRHSSMGMLGKKHSKETKQKMRIKHKGLNTWSKGKKCHFWKGGISFEPYGLDFNRDLKEVIRNRDRRKCQICEKTELENKEKLSVHHIDYNKQNNNIDNLVSLCRNCHRKTNFNRNNWIKYFYEC